MKAPSAITVARNMKVINKSDGGKKKSQRIMRENPKEGKHVFEAGRSSQGHFGAGGTNHRRKEKKERAREGFRWLIKWLQLHFCSPPWRQFVDRRNQSTLTTTTNTDDTHGCQQREALECGKPVWDTSFVGVNLFLSFGICMD